MSTSNRKMAEIVIGALEREAVTFQNPAAAQAVQGLIQYVRELEAGWDGLHVASNAAIDQLEARIALLERVREAATYVLTCPDPGENRASTLEADAKWHDEWMARSQAEEGLQFALDALGAK